MAIDVNEILKVAPPIVQAISVLVTAVFAVLSLRAWRKQLVGKRRFEVAEEVVISVYRVEEAFNAVRFPLSTSDEAAARKPDRAESDDERRRRDTYFIPQKRLQDANEVFIQLRKIRLLCQVHFLGAVEHIDRLLDIRTDIVFAAQQLSHGVEPDVEKELRATVYSARTLRSANKDQDAVATDVENAVKAIERNCRPYLR